MVDLATVAVVGKHFLHDQEVEVNAVALVYHPILAAQVDTASRCIQLVLEMATCIVILHFSISACEKSVMGRHLPCGSLRRFLLYFFRWNVTSVPGATVYPHLG